VAIYRYTYIDPWLPPGVPEAVCVQDIYLYYDIRGRLEDFSWRGGDCLGLIMGIPLPGEDPDQGKLEDIYMNPIFGVRVLSGGLIKPFDQSSSSSSYSSNSANSPDLG
jgi:hypothetical protein